MRGTLEKDLRLFVKFFLCLCLMCFAAAATAATSLPTLTPTCVNVHVPFGTNGFVSNNSAAGGTGDDYGYASAVDSSGRVYVAGISAASEGGSNAVVLRYSSAGVRDMSYGGVGQGRINFDPLASITARAGAIKIDADGKLLITGSTVISGVQYIFVSRYKEDGTLDQSFNTTGMQTMAGIGGYGLVIDKNQRIIVAARINAVSLRLIRLNPNGTLDGSFGTTANLGYVDFAGGSSDFSKMGIALDSQGCIYVTDTKNGHVAFWKFNLSGIIEWATTASIYILGSGYDKGNAIMLSALDQVYIVGTATSGATTKMFISKVNMQYGNFDTTFGTNGFVTFNGTGMNSFGNDFTFNSNSELLITGAINSGTQTDMALWKYKLTGVLDYNFTTSGYISGGYAGAGVNQGYSVVTCPGTENILVVGNTHNGVNKDIALWMYRDRCNFAPAIVPPVYCVEHDSGFDTDGYVLETNGSSNASGSGICTDASGANIYITGKSTNSYGNDCLRVWKYSSAGVKDTSFNVNVGSYDMAAEGMDIKMDSGGGLIVVGKNSDRGGLKIRVSRYLTTGALDLSFGGTGTGSTFIPGQGYNVLIDNSNKILIAARLNNTTLRLVRLTSTGYMDTSFSGDGIVDFPGGISGNTSKMGLALQSGKILVADSKNNDLAVWRFSSAGILDTTFGAAGTGVATVADIIASGAVDKGTGMVVGPDELIYITGSSKISVSETMFLARLTPDGIISGYGELGSVFTAVRFNGLNSVSRGNDILLDNTGNLIITGYIQKGSAGGAMQEMAMWRYSVVGLRDVNFNIKGYVPGDRMVSNMAEGFDAVRSPTGQLITTGLTKNALGNNDMAAWSYLYTCGGGGFFMAQPPISALAVSKASPEPTEKYSTMDYKETYMFPNPANETATIRFPLNKQEEVRIAITDINGKTVWRAIVPAGNTSVGINSVIWNTVNDNGNKVSNGVYIVTISAGSKSVTKKIAVVK